MRQRQSSEEAIICIAAGKSQMPVITEAKRMGYIVIAVDINPDAPGFAYSDLKIVQSTYDPKAIIHDLDILYSNAEEKYSIIAVVNRSSGPPVVTTAEICKHLNIPNMYAQAAKTIVNKGLLRKACKKHKIPIPEFETYSIDQEHIEPQLNLPFVVKPSLSLVGKSGVGVVREKKTLSRAIEYSKDKTENQEIIIEKYLNGRDIGLTGFIIEGKVSPICLIEEINHELIDGKIIPKGMKTLSFVENKSWYDQSLEISQQLVNIFEIERSAWNISFRSDSDNNLNLIEVHLDLGGDLLIEQVFPRALPFNFLHLAIDLASGKKRYPNHFDIKPTAILYEEGTNLVNEKGFNVFSEKTQKLLDQKISDLSK